MRNPAAVAAALQRFRHWCAGIGFRVLAEAPAAVTGAEGNQEWLLHLQATP